MLQCAAVSVYQVKMTRTTKTLGWRSRNNAHVLRQYAAVRMCKAKTTAERIIMVSNTEHVYSKDDSGEDKYLRCEEVSSSEDVIIWDESGATVLTRISCARPHLYLKEFFIFKVIIINVSTWDHLYWLYHGYIHKIRRVHVYLLWHIYQFCINNFLWCKSISRPAPFWSIVVFHWFILKYTTNIKLKVPYTRLRIFLAPILNFVLFHC